MATVIGQFLSASWRDVRYAARQLRRAPAFSLTVLFTLAVAMGATAAMTGVLRATLLANLPYSHSQQLVAIGDENLRGFKTNGLIAAPRADALAHLQHDGHKVFAGVATLYENTTQLATAGHDASALAGAAVAGDFFPTIASPPLLGRTIVAADDTQGEPMVAVLSERLWASLFARDRGVLGKTVLVDGKPATIVGVMPASFNLPLGIDIWYPARIRALNFGGYRGDGSRFVRVLARLDPRETVRTAKQQATLLAARLAQQYPQTDAAWGFQVTGLRESLFGSSERVLVLLAAAIALMLIVAAFNIAGLQLSRNARRQPEFAIRSALGVTRARLVRQLLTESMVLVLASSVIGLGLGAACLRVIASRLSGVLLLINEPHIGQLAVAVTCAIALGAGLLAGILPAIGSTRASLVSVGRAASPRTSGFSGKAFTVLQVALALVLLTLSASVLQGLYTLLHTRLGFDTTQLQTCSIDLPWSSEVPRRHRVYQQVESSLSELPGVEAAGAITALPLSNFSVRTTFDVLGRSPTPHHDAVVAEERSITPGYLGAMHVPLLTGRALTARDAEPSAPPVMLINQTFARRYFGEADPIGKHLVGALGVNGTGASEIVGVMGDVRGTGGALSNPLQPEIYTPEQGGWPHMQFAVRTTLPEATLERELRRLVAGVDASASISHYAPLAATLDRSVAQPRWNAALLTGFAAVSLLLVVIGVYGLVAFDLAERTRELAVRIALGASRAGLLRLLLIEASRTLGIGLAFGALGGWMALRAAVAAGTGASGATALVLAASIAAIALAVLAATLIPARRAVQVDPMQALRSE